MDIVLYLVHSQKPKIVASTPYLTQFLESNFWGGNSTISATKFRSQKLCQIRRTCHKYWNIRMYTYFQLLYIIYVCLLVHTNIYIYYIYLIYTADHINLHILCYICILVHTTMYLLCILDIHNVSRHSSYIRNVYLLVHTSI